MAAIEIQGQSKRYGAVAAVDGLTALVAPCSTKPGVDQRRVGIPITGGAKVMRRARGTQP